MKDEQGIEFAVYTAESERNPVILITNPESYSRVGKKLEEHGVIAMKRPVERKIFSCALRDAIVFGRVFDRLKKREPGAEGKHRRNEAGEPGKGNAHVSSEHDGIPGAQIHRKTGHGSESVEKECVTEYSQDILQ